MVRMTILIIEYNTGRQHEWYTKSETQVGINRGR